MSMRRALSMRGAAMASCRGFLGAGPSATSSTTQQDFDVVVFGGGMIGSALACLLKQSPLTSELKVAVVDRNAPSSPSSSIPDLPQVPDIRVSTLTPSTLALIDRVGANWAIHSTRSASFQDMQVWDQTASRKHMRFSGSGEGPLGRVVENEVIKSALQRRAQELGCEYASGGVKEVLAPRPRVGITREAGDDDDLCDRPSVVFEDGRVLSAPLLVGADGSESIVAKSAGIRYEGRAYGQRAVTCTVDVSRPFATAFQRFLPTGPIALLPVRGGRGNIVWSTTPEHARRLESLGARDFAAEATEALTVEGGPVPSSSSSSRGGGGWESALASRASALLGLRGGASPPAAFEDPPEVVSVAGGRQRSFPLASKHALTYCQRGVVLVGDAAHRIHPLAGQGVNIGFGDCELLVTTIQEALWSGQDFSANLTLEKYAAERRNKNGAMIRSLDAVRALYQSESPYVEAARSLGMDLINGFGPLKQVFVGFASSNAAAADIRSP